MSIEAFHGPFSLMRVACAPFFVVAIGDPRAIHLMYPYYNFIEKDLLEIAAAIYWSQERLAGHSRRGPWKTSIWCSGTRGAGFITAFSRTSESARWSEPSKACLDESRAELVFALGALGIVS